MANENENENMNEPPLQHPIRTLRDYTTPNLNGTTSSITRPRVEANNFEIKPAIMQMLSTSIQYGETTKLRNKIMTFVHHDQESFYDAWARFKDLLRKLDAAVGGSFEKKGIDEAYELIEEMASNNHYQNNSERKRTTGVYKIDAITALNAKVDNMVRKLDMLTTNPVNSTMQVCDRCNGQHGIGECMIDSLNPQTLEQRKQQNPVSCDKKLGDSARTVYKHDGIQSSSYAKFLKDILSKKWKIDDQGTVMLAEEWSAIIQNKLPPKLKDPGSFSIPCNIGNLDFEKSLADLGASINLMSYEVFKMLGMGELKPTRMSLPLN
ncbi:uncharacterized protein LOC119369065 [Jatropha curcas]|uniref:uncharacterized protein LOC119369065 n=1 Tax=Jatropha curcas TaxID=180498 RepID=UPI001894CD85|nr:uncharacterized protein LOC119369065 [Jatropha curcas]